MTILQGQYLQVDIIFSKPAGQLLVAHCLFLPVNQVKRPYLKKMSAGGGSKIHLVPSEGLVMVLDLLSFFTTLVHWCLVN